ncbi:MAG: hypothetical protein V4577_26405 [Bacteroidota bacterium]
MKVMCISDKWMCALGKEKAARPAIGDIDLVIEEERDKGDGRLFYRLERFGDESWFRCDMFATLPNSTADEMQEESREAIVNLETV